ncbi:hypothetical protein [Poseidonibacter ostreae]|uniref:Uncharacterized protein n=1 Tax=Poseidonibacter ostreae TaxID=2654171 RepID=A0A6L4WWJ8_9BACT|nr:hypothetical protein [Poseidonibacter ostreae]KAB7891406.1 hypothetical protein GBG19_00790 [Poseidonibacter ostreae]
MKKIITDDMELVQECIENEDIYVFDKKSDEDANSKFNIIRGIEKYAQNENNSIRIDCRLYEDYNDKVIETYLKDEAKILAKINDIDVDGTISIYGEEREDWYVSYTVREEDNQLYIIENEELRNQVVLFLNSMFSDLKTLCRKANEDSLS